MKSEARYLKKNPLGEKIGVDRLFETMVFRTKGRCITEECGCQLPLIDGMEVAFSGANTRIEATKNHFDLCEKFSKIKE